MTLSVNFQAPRRALLGGLLLAVLFMAAPACQADPDARAFMAALDAYKAGDYAAAAQGMESIAARGVRNGRLYYNLGNAYLKRDDLGRAILWYERASKLLPNDPDLDFNLQYARSLTRDAREEETAPLTDILFFWNRQLDPRTIKILALACNAVFWSLLIALRLTRRPGLRRAAAIAVFPAVLLILTALYNDYEAGHARTAIVLPEQVSVRSGLDDSATELFRLHAGAKVQVVRSMNEHVQIRFSNDKIGWLPAKALGLV